MIDSNIVELCRAYADLICAARKLHVAWVRSPGNSNYGSCLIAAAHKLYGAAPIDAMPHLDTVKRVLEIDTTITTVSVVLLRASLMTEDAS
jgi:hypothetical protein